MARRARRSLLHAARRAGSTPRSAAAPRRQQRQRRAGELDQRPRRAGSGDLAPEEASAFFACASTSRSRGTICVNTICAALPAVVFTVPIDEAADIQPGIDSQPSHHASGTLATARPIEISPTTYTGSLRTRSSHTPDGQREQHERHDLHRRQHAHLRRAGAQQHRRRERQGEQRHLAAERADQDRRPQAPVGRVAQQVVGAAAQQRAAELSSLSFGNHVLMVHLFLLRDAAVSWRAACAGLWARCSGGNECRSILPLISQRPSIEELRVTRSAPAHGDGPTDRLPPCRR